MFTLVYGDDLQNFPTLTDQMLRDRGTQFKEALGWDLHTDEKGRETDQYDLMNPLYLILRNDKGQHIGSTRLMPTTGPTMIADHFSHLTDGVEIESPLIWETTRFFVSKKANRREATALMWAGCQFGLQSGISFYVGVTGAHMVRVFSACGWTSEVLGRSSSPEGDICACLWEVSEELCEKLRRRAGIEKGEYHLSVYRKQPEGQSVPVETPGAALLPTDRALPSPLHV